MVVTLRRFRYGIHRRNNGKTAMAQAPKSVRVTLRASEDETMLSGCDVVLEVPDADEAALTADGGVITGTVVSGDFGTCQRV